LLSCALLLDVQEVSACVCVCERERERKREKEILSVDHRVITWHAVAKYASCRKGTLQFCKLNVLQRQ
jgi:hypothetical protein